MITKLKTAPAALALSVADAKTHMNITFSTDDDYIETLINAATKYCENYTARKLINQTWLYYPQFWPAESYIKLPFGDLQSITSIKYYDIEDTEYVWSTDYYYVDTASVPGRVILKYNQSWPEEELRPDNPIVIEFVSGYGANAAAITDYEYVHALKIMTAHYYENRELVYISVNSNTLTDVPKSVDVLLYPLRVWDWLI